MSDNVTREPYRNAWYKQLQKAIEEAEPRLVPEYNADDAGKILSVDEEGKQKWTQPPEELPVIHESDEGKVLKVDEGIPKWLEDKDSEIPSHTTSDEGKMLSVNSQNGLEWKDIPKELPSATPADVGKTLSVDSNGLPEWATASGADNKFKFYHGTYNSSDRSINASNSVSSSQLITDIHNGYIPVITYNFNDDILGYLFITRGNNSSSQNIEGYSILRTSESRSPAYLIFYSARDGAVYFTVSVSCWLHDTPIFPSFPSNGKYALIANVSNYNITFAWEKQS